MLYHWATREALVSHDLWCNCLPLCPGSWQRLGTWPGEPKGGWVLLHPNWCVDILRASSAQISDFGYRVFSPQDMVAAPVTGLSSSTYREAGRAREASPSTCLHPLRPFSWISSLQPHVYKPKSHAYLQQAFVKLLVCARLFGELKRNAFWSQQAHSLAWMNFGCWEVKGVSVKQ